jgi:hypothetical protein
VLVGIVHANGPAPPDSSAVRVHDFATLTAADAWRLDGKEALFRIALDSDEDEWDGWLCYDCAGEGAPLRSVRLIPGQELADRMTVKATLRVRNYPAFVGTDEGRMGPLWEYRLVGALRVCS